MRIILCLLALASSCAPLPAADIGAKIPIPTAVSDPFAADAQFVGTKRQQPSACNCACGCGTTGVCTCRQQQAVQTAPVQQLQSAPVYQTVCDQYGCRQVLVTGSPYALPSYVGSAPPSCVNGSCGVQALGGGFQGGGCANGSCGASQRRGLFGFRR